MLSRMVVVENWGQNTIRNYNGGIPRKASESFDESL